MDRVNPTPARIQLLKTPRPLRLNEKRLRIIHVINDLSVGGAEMMLFKLLAQTDRARFDPIVVALRNRGRLHDDIERLGVPIYDISMRLPMPTPTSCLRLLRLITRLNPDLIHGWMYHGSLAASLCAAWLWPAVPVIWNIRQSLNGHRYEKWTTSLIIRLLARLSSLPNRIVYNSRIASAQHTAIGYEAKNGLVIPNGFMTDVFVPSDDARTSLRNELGVGDDTLLIGLAGRYHPVKDHPTFLKAAARVLKTHPDVQFLLCGHRINWINVHLAALIEELEIAERVHLLDQRHDMPRLLASLDIAVSSSSAESFPNSIGEAMSCGVPCVVTDVSDLVWIVGEAGRIVPPNSPESLAQGLRELLDLQPEMRRQLGFAARERVRKLFPLKTISGTFERLYDEVIQANSSTSSNLQQGSVATESQLRATARRRPSGEALESQDHG